ncbi:hypothetical protein BC833DRAFT_564761, partial [Globomyces pollinis-pini]
TIVKKNYIQNDKNINNTIISDSYNVQKIQSPNSQITHNQRIQAQSPNSHISDDQRIQAQSPNSQITHNQRIQGQSSNSHISDDQRIKESQELQSLNSQISDVQRIEESQSLNSQSSDHQRIQEPAERKRSPGSKQLSKSVYLTFLHHYTSKNNISISDVNIWYKRLINANYKPNLKIINRIMIACRKQPFNTYSNITLAEKYFLELAIHNITPDSIAFGALISSYTKLNDLKKIETILKMMEHHDIPLNPYLIHSLVDFYIHHNHFDRVWKLLLIIETQFEPNLKGILFSPDISCRKLQKVKDVHINNPQPIVWILTSLIKGYFTIDRNDMSIYYLNVISKFSLVPSVGFYSVILQRIRESNNDQVVMEILKVLHQSGLVLCQDVHSQSLLSMKSKSVLRLSLVMELLCSTSNDYVTQTAISSSLFSHLSNGDIYSSLKLYEAIKKQKLDDIELLKHQQITVPHYLNSCNFNIPLLGFTKLVSIAIRNVDVDTKRYWANYFQDEIQLWVTKQMDFDNQLLTQILMICKKLNIKDYYFDLIGTILTNMNVLNETNHDMVHTKITQSEDLIRHLRKVIILFEKEGDDDSLCKCRLLFAYFIQHGMCTQPVFELVQRCLGLVQAALWRLEVGMPTSDRKSQHQILNNRRRLKSN